MSSERHQYSNHFNLPDHSLKHLKVQPINKASSSDELRELEHFWIGTLKTLQPSGLNVTSRLLINYQTFVNSYQKFPLAIPKNHEST